nr:MAG TPA: hypothetical protein [Caudoviricetes sp.]DAJ54044.1 MAG TPA: hypothetical protein [Caudoviricetes sp.]
MLPGIPFFRTVYITLCQTAYRRILRTEPALEFT